MRKCTIVIAYCLSLTQNSQVSQVPAGELVNLIETNRNDVRHCNENQNSEYHPQALEVIHWKSNHHRYP